MSNEKRTISESADLAMRAIFEAGQKQKDKNGNEIERANPRDIIAAKKYLEEQEHKKAKKKRKGRRIVARF